MNPAIWQVNPPVMAILIDRPSHHGYSGHARKGTAPERNQFVEER